MANVTRSGRKLKDDDNDSKTASTASGSTNSDTSGLRRSARETPSKKQQTASTSPSSTRKSPRIEKRTPPTPPSKKVSDRVEKQRMPSPLRRSERGAENNPSSDYSSGLRKSERGKNLTDNGKHPTEIARDMNEDGEKDGRPVRIVLGKKRLDARSYRESLLKPQAKKTQLSDKPKEQDKTSQGYSVHTGTSSSKEVKDVAGDIGRNRGEVGEKDAAGCSDRAAEGPCSGLRDSDGGRPENFGELELCQSSRKRKIHSDEFHESTHEDSTPGSKSNNNPMQSSQGVAAKDTVRDDDKMQVDCSLRDNLPNISLEATSEGRSISGDQCLEKAYPIGPSKRMRKSEELDASVPAANEEINSSSDPVTSSPSESKRSSFLERCNACSKRQRVDIDSQKCDMCPCSFRKKHDSCDKSSLEAVREEAANPENGEIPMGCAPEDHEMNVNHFDRNTAKDIQVHGSELLLEAERNGEHDQTIVHTTVDISKPVEEDGGELRSGSCAGLNDECGSKIQLNVSPLDTQKGDHRACVICKFGGKLLCCDGKGCKRNYHLHCLDPPVKVVPLVVWHCFQCIKRKIQFGVHSVSEIESIWDVKEGDPSDGEGIQKQKQYLVKYKGLSHVHNHWIPEHQLRLGSPSLVARFKKNQVLKWKSEWMKPQRLVQKRALMSPNQLDEIGSDCQYEWFVKWCGLGYEHATWELESAPFLRSSEAITLMKDYETRLQKAILASNPSREKLLEERKLSCFKLSQLQGKNISGLDNDHLSFVNKLFEYWQKNQNAVLAEDQERISKVVLFILSVQSDVGRPFIIISTSSSISAWETEFMRSAPSVNVVVYNGNKAVREVIQALEFYEDGGCVMLQVLLAPIDAIVEDMEAIESIGWEAVVIDECQRSTVSRHFEQINNLTNGFRMLLLSGPMKESMAEYLNLLSFIESGCDQNGDVNVKVDFGDSISKLKERFARFVVCEQKSDSKFLEFWVPVHLSNLQLEQYCATLLSNSISLRSCSKNDPVGALRDILISVRKCCDHPYLLDGSLQSLLTKDLPEVEYLDVGVNASGKLQVLDRVLPDIRKRGLRVLILFQSIGGSGRNFIGDILDDFMRQRFGPDSYERVDSGLVTSKKQAALNMFNNRERGRFVFLIENRACLPSIKLSSVDMAIIFDSDWNPLNDLRALQKISVDSQFEQLKVFRLYSSSTVEEKVLCFAKQDMTLESSIQNINRSTSHTLLLWGACFLFHKLDDFHSGGAPSSGSNILSEQSFVNDVVQEFLSQLPNNAEISDKKNCEIIIKAQQSGTSYSKDIILLGEKEMQLGDEELPHVLWTKVLEGRCPQWRFSSGPSQRIRRKVQYYDDSTKKPQVNDEVVKKRKKGVGNIVEPNTLKRCLDNKRKSVSMDKDGTSGTPICNGSQNLPASVANTDSLNNPSADKPVMQMAESNERRNLRDSQKDLHLSLKPVILKLCELLQLPDDVKSMAGKFLEYIMNNHNVSREPVAIFQALQIALCWSAASLLKYKISHRKSLSLAKQHFHFQCNEEETDVIYTKLRELKKMFSHQGNCVETVSAENSLPKEKEKEQIHSRASPTALSAQQELEEGEIRESPKIHKFSIKLNCSNQKQSSDAEDVSGSSKNGSSDSVRQVKRTHRRRLSKLYQMQMEEFEKFNKNKEKILEKRIADLELRHQAESALIPLLHSQQSIQLEKMSMIDQEFERKKEELNFHMDTQQKKLEAMQRKARSGEKQMKAHWLEEAKLGRPVSPYAMLPLSDSGFRGENMEELEQVIVSPENSDSGFNVEHIDDCERGGVIREKATASSSSGEQDADGVLSVFPAEPVAVETCSTVPNNVVEILALGPASFSMQLDEMGRELSTLVSESATETGSKQKRSVSNTGLPFISQSLVDVLSDQSHVASSQDNPVPSFQVQTYEHALPSVPEEGIQGIEVEIQTSGTTDALLLNQVNDVTPVLPTAPHLHLSPSVDPASTQQTQPEIPACIQVDQVQTDVSLQQFELPLQLPAEGQDVIVDNFCSLPGDRFSQAASQQAQDPFPLSDLPATEQSEPEGSACTGLTGKHFMHAASQPTPASGAAPLLDPPFTEENLLEVPQSTCTLLEHISVSPVPATFQDPPLTEQSQPELSASTCIDREQRNERDASEPFPDNQITQIRAQPLQLPQQQPAMEQTELLNHSILRPSAQSRLHLPLEPSAPGGGSRLSEPRSMNPFSESSPRPPHISAVSSRIPQHLCHDPLQNELGRIHREEEQVVKMHEDEKIRLNSECEKEMEEIRRKYNSMLQDAEKEFMQKKKVLETTFNIVYMNRILAEAFRLKCDARTAGAPGVQQGAPSGSMQQAFRLPSPQVAPRPAPIVVPPTGPPASPPMQMVHQPSALFSNNPVRSQMSQVLSPKGNHQITTELRAPAPHLQPFRPSTCMPTPSLSPLSCMLPGQQLVSKSTSTSIHPQRISRPSTHMSGPFSRPHQSENVSGVRGSHNSSLSAIELLMDMERHRSPNPQSLLHTAQDIGQPVDTWDPTEMTMNCRATPTVRTGTAADVVCLSDDD